MWISQIILVIISMLVVYIVASKYINLKDTGFHS